MSRSLAPCTSCGESEFWISYSNSPIKARMDLSGECFTCAFWEVTLSEKDSKRIVIDYHVYSIGEEPKQGSNTNKSDLGMSGRRFDIELLSTGQKFTTHNLWSGSEIPERYRHRIENNARFLNGGDKAQVGEVTCWNPVSESLSVYPSYEEIMKQHLKG